MKQEGQQQQKTEIGDVAMKALELSQRLKEKWLKADIAEKRVIFKIACFNLTFKDEKSQNINEKALRRYGRRAQF
ncbi:MAG: hypothetical protein LBE31_09205 [Deltaproteobacteria bacterium]|nr:hypothetical protein [Deltaproteobacteria bacterium]